jgi:hypothetical protein
MNRKMQSYREPHFPLGESEYCLAESCTSLVVKVECKSTRKAKRRRMLMEAFFLFKLKANTRGAQGLKAEKTGLCCSC